MKYNRSSKKARPVMTMGARILLIEDDQTHIMLCQRALASEHYGFDVQVATSGEEALMWLTDSDGKGYEAIVMDNKLPDYYGLELLARLKERAPNTPIIMVTGYRDDELALEAL